jgi:hypothetical protein
MMNRNLRVVVPAGLVVVTLIVWWPTRSRASAMPTRRPHEGRGRSDGRRASPWCARVGSWSHRSAT